MHRKTNEFGMNNRIAATAYEGFLVRAATNVTFPAPGHCQTRRGIDTAVAGTNAGVDLVIGTAPYQYLTWTPSTTTYRIWYGADAIAFVNPRNGYLYTRTSGGAGEIYTTSLTPAFSAWGLTTSGSFTTDEVSQMSELPAATYKLYACAWDPLRWCYGAPVEGVSITAGAQSSSIQYLTGPGYSIQLPALPTGGTKIRVFMVVTQTSSPSSGFTPKPLSIYPATDARLLAEPVFTTGTYDVTSYTAGPPAQSTVVLSGGVFGMASTQSLTPTGGTSTPFTVVSGGGTNTIVVNGDARGSDNGGHYSIPPIIDHLPGESERLAWHHTVVPYGPAFMQRDGRVFYGGGTGYTFGFAYSNPWCPETYAKTVTVGGLTIVPLLAEGPQGAVWGEAETFFSAQSGNLVAFAAYGRDAMLALCQYGAWTVDSPDGISYGVTEDRLAVGTTSRATVVPSPYGVGWTSWDGEALWAGQGVPNVVTRAHLDLYAAPLSTTVAGLETAFSAYDWKRGIRVTALPQASGSPVLLVSHMQFLEYPQSGKPQYAVWTLGQTDTLVGMGYDNVLGEIVYLFSKTTGGTTTRYARYMGTGYADVNPSSDASVTVAASIDGYWCEPNQREVIDNPAAFLIPYRASAAQAQSVTATWTGLPLDDTAAGVTPVSETVTFAANTRQGMPTSAGVSGKLIRLQLAWQSAYAFDLQELQVGDPGDIGNRRNG